MPVGLSFGLVDTMTLELFLGCLTPTPAPLGDRRPERMPASPWWGSWGLSLRDRARLQRETKCADNPYPKTMVSNLPAPVRFLEIFLGLLHKAQDPVDLGFLSGVGRWVLPPRFSGV